MKKQVLAQTGYPPFKKWICIIFGTIGVLVGLFDLEMSMYGASSMITGAIFLTLGIWSIHEGSLSVKLYNDEVVYRKWLKTKRIPINTNTECNEEIIYDVDDRGNSKKDKILSISSSQTQTVIKLSANYLHHYSTFKKAITKQIYGASATNTFQRDGKIVVRTKKK